MVATTLATRVLQMARAGHGKDRFGHPAQPGDLILTMTEVLDNDDLHRIVYALVDNQLLMKHRELHFILTETGNRVLNVLNGERPITASNELGRT